jgi:endonuclease YncB( thermonuclease family)
VRPILGKKTEQEVQDSIDLSRQGVGGVKTTEDPFSRARKVVLRDGDYERLKKLSPREIIRSARSFEELMAIKTYLQTLPKSVNTDFWDDYHTQRRFLATQPSLLNVKSDGTGQWAAPMQAREYLVPGGNPHNPRDWRVQRNLTPSPVSFDQLFGEKQAWKVENGINGPKYKNWHPLKMPALPSNRPKDVIIFDLEATGLLKKKSNIVSMALSTNEGYTKGIYSPFPERKFDPFIEKVIRPNWKNAIAGGATTVSEQALVEEFISTLESGPKTLMGYNIRGYDIPLMHERAAEFGLTKRLSAALEKSTIFDVAEYAMPWLSRQMGEEYPGWGRNAWGTKPLGWQLEPVAKALGFASNGLAHDAKVDVEMTKFVADMILNKSDEAAKIFQQNLPQYLEDVKASTGKEVYKIKAGLGTLDYTFSMKKDENYYKRSFSEHLDARFPHVRPVEKESLGKFASKVSGVSKGIGGKVKEAKVLGPVLSFVGLNMLFPGGFWSNAAGSIAFEATRMATKKSLPGWKGMAAGVVGSVATISLFRALTPTDETSDLDIYSALGGNQFSGFDDSYNTTAGFNEGGMAQENRHALSDFGSGYQGLFSSLVNKFAPSSYKGDLPTNMMGIDIDPEVLEFRENVIKDKEALAALEARIKEKQEETQGKTGDFTEADFSTNTNMSLMQGLNLANQNLRAVDTSKFNLSVEDADTVILTRKGIVSLFSDPISIRLSGIDAPEVASHDDDPMAEIRIWQEQAYGQEASSHLRRMVENAENIQLIVNTKDKTYGRSLGVLMDAQNRNLNLALLSEGAASALPFGDPRKDIMSRKMAEAAQQQAIQANEGMWQYARYKAIYQASQAIGAPLTYNTLTDLTRLSKNLNVGAYGSFLESLGDEQRNLTEEELATSKRVGYALQKTHGPNSFKKGKKKYSKDAPTQQRWSGRDDEYNTIEGLKHGGWAQFVRKELTDFGSGWDPLRQIAKSVFGHLDDEGAFKALTSSEEFKSAIQMGLKTPGKELGQGVTASVKSYQSTLNIAGQSHDFEFAVKRLDPSRGATLQETAHESSVLQQLGSERAPSFYGRETDFGMDISSPSIFMEKFNVSPNKVSKVPLSQKELTDAESFLAGAHTKEITHTDLHSGNLVRTFTSQGKEEVGFLDWGMANRFKEVNGIGGIQDMGLAKSGGRKVLEELKSRFGRDVDIHEYSKAQDITRLRAWSNPNASEASHKGINVIYEHSRMTARRNELINEVGSFDPKIPVPKVPASDDPALNDALELVKRRKKLKDHFSNELALEEKNRQINMLEARIKESVENTYQYSSSKSLTSPAPLTPPVDLARSKRMKKFRESSINSVGIGLKSAHNGSRGHCHSTTTRKS